MQKEIYLYSQESSKNPTYFAVQGDTGRNLKCHILDVDVANEVTSAQIYVKKPDGTNVCNNGTINEDGTVTVPITSQTLAAVGKAKAMLQLTGPDGYISTYEFIIKILETIIDEQAAESSDEWGALQEALYQVSTIGRLADLLTTVKTTIVAAVNEVVTNIGNLSSLTTMVKTSIVAAVNELVTAISGKQNTLTAGAGIDITDDTISADFSTITAGDISYNNTASGLTAVDVQGAIDELGMFGNGMINQPVVSVAATAGQYTTFAENVLPKGYRWLLFGMVSWSINSTSTIVAGFTLDDTSVDYTMPIFRNTAVNGGGCSIWGYVSTKDKAVTAGIRSYGTTQGTYNHQGSYIAIPIQKL